MFVKRVVLVCSLVCLLAAQHVAAHSWMVNPTPRGGGGGSGQASTSAPCGQGAVTAAPAVRGTYAPGSAISIGFQRANGHGSTCSATFSICTATPTVCQSGSGTFTPIGTATIDCSQSGIQTATPTIPANTPATEIATLQYKASLTGSLWYDCAFIKIGTAAVNDPCATKTCANKATCVNGACVCNGGYFGNGDTSCTLISTSSYVLVNVTLILPMGTSTVPAPAVLQNPFTNAVAQMLGISPGRIYYDMEYVVGNSNPKVVVVQFFLIPDATTGQPPTGLANQFLSSIASGDSTLPAAISTAGTIQVAGASTKTSSAVFGSNPPSDDTNRAWIAAAVLVPLAVLIAAGAAFYYYRKRDKDVYYASTVPSSTTNTTNGYALTPPIQNSYAPQYSPEGAASAAAPAAAYGGSTAAPGVPPRPGVPARALPGAPVQYSLEWSQEMDEQGHLYFFNNQTGQSQWEKPTGINVRPYGSTQ